MMNSKTLLNKLLGSPTKKALLIYRFLSYFIDASYLATKHYSGTIPPCAIVKGREAVTTSQYAVVGGVSVALLGAIYYLVVLIISIAIIETRKASLKKVFGWIFCHRIIYFTLVYFFVIICDKGLVPLLPRFYFFFHIYFYTCKMAFNVIQFKKLVIFK